MFKRIIILLILVCVLAVLNCISKKNKTDKQVLDFGALTIETPKTWTKVKAQGIDSYVGEIAIDSKDTIGFDLGRWSNDLEEHAPPIMKTPSFIIFGKDTLIGGPPIVDYPELYVPEKNKKNKIIWDTIDGYKAKIVFPKRPGLGTTGIYIDSLWPSYINNDRFNLYGTNLKPENEKLFLEAIKTIKFHKPK